MQRFSQRRNVISSFTNSLFLYISLHSLFLSSVPLLSRLLPSDVCRIYKCGSCIRYICTCISTCTYSYGEYILNTLSRPLKQWSEIPLYHLLSLSLFPPPLSLSTSSLSTPLPFSRPSPSLSGWIRHWGTSRACSGVEATSVSSSMGRSLAQTPSQWWSWTTTPSPTPE